jgi:hypothetical protein
MKALLRKILTNGLPIREYATLSIDGKIQEKVFLKTTSPKYIEISRSQFVLCLHPLVVGLWVDDPSVLDELQKEKTASLVFTSGSQDKKKLAEAKMELVKVIDRLLLLKINTTSLHHLPAWKMKLLFNRYFKKPSQPWEVFKSYVTAYSYPRKVRLISFLAGEHYNIFPMDLVGELPGEKKMFFGLRHSNRSLGEIIKAGKLVASEVPATKKELIYQLGTHHGSTPRPIRELPFETKSSKIFGFPVPVFASSYKEIIITAHHDLGSHMLLCGEIDQEVKLTEEIFPSLYHIHFLHLLDKTSHYDEV